MTNLPVPIGPLGNPTPLLEAWREVIKLRDSHSAQQVAYTMASQALNSGHDEWRLGENIEPIISQITEILLDLETSQSNSEWQVEQWQTIVDLLDQK